MSELTEILQLVESYSLSHAQPDSDLFEHLGIRGDDFHELIAKFAKKYSVDMSEYLWYFHSDEEGFNPMEMFVTPPYKRVSRIPITPQLLSEFAFKKKWKIDYPVHQLPKRRWDLRVNTILVIGFLLAFGIWILIKAFS